VTSHDAQGVRGSSPLRSDTLRPTGVMDITMDITTSPLVRRGFEGVPEGVFPFAIDDEDRVRARDSCCAQSGT
jgi:hypothetical protein